MTDRGHEKIEYIDKDLEVDGTITASGGLTGVYSHINYADPDANMGNRRTQAILGGGAYRFNFSVPAHYSGTLKFELLGFPQAGAPGASKDIDLIGDYTTADGSDYQEHTFSDTTSTYTVGELNSRWALDFTTLITNAAPGTEGGILVDHKSIGGTIAYIGIRVTST